MTDFKALAAALNVYLREDDVPRVVDPLEKLERDLASLRDELAHDAPLWCVE